MRHSASKVSWLCAGLVLALGSVFLSGCARAPLATPQGEQPLDGTKLLGYVCGGESPGRGLTGAKGSVWLKAKSKEASGQFPAMVEARAPGSVYLQVINLIGGTEATIKVDGQHYTIHVPDKAKAQTQEGYHSWAGIPLEWATQLFLGRVPCAPEGALKDAELKITGEDQLVVSTRASLSREPEVFRYKLRSWQGKPWPEALTWERRGTVPITVDFKFSEPQAETGSPGKWEAKSAAGEVKVRWRDREVSR